MLTTTFTLLKAHDACVPRYRHLAKALGGISAYGADTPIPLLTILDTNGLDDALWALRAVPDTETALRDRVGRLFACDCAERVLSIFERERPDDARPRETIAVARRFAEGRATRDELSAAWDAAGAAAGDAAGDAAWTAAWDAAGAAAGDAAGAAAWAAAGDAAWTAEVAWQTARLRERLAGVPPTEEER